MGWGRGWGWGEGGREKGGSSQFLLDIEMQPIYGQMLSVEKQIYRHDRLSEITYRVTGIQEETCAGETTDALEGVEVDGGVAPAAGASDGEACQ